jgi:hypothetical protein
MFADGQDLDQAVFSKAPRLPSSVRGEAPGPPTSPTWMKQYGVTGILLLGSLLLLGWLFKIK